MKGCRAKECTHKPPGIRESKSKHKRRKERGNREEAEVQKRDVQRKKILATGSRREGAERQLNAQLL